MNGVDSSLVGSLLSLRDRYLSSSKGDEQLSSTVPLAGVLLFTDGQATDRSEWTSLKEMGVLYIQWFVRYWLAKGYSDYFDQREPKPTLKLLP